MKKLLALILTLAATSAVAQSTAQSSGETGGAEAAKSPAATAVPASKAHILTNAEFDALLAKPQKLLIIDVRRPDEVSDIGGFPVYLSVQINDLEKSTAWIPKDRRIVVVSNHANRGAKGADILAARGFKVLGAIGAQTYEQAGGTLAKFVKPAPRATAQAAAEPK